MLLIAKSLKELSASILLDVYAESNLKKGRELTPFESEYQQLYLGEQDFYSYLLDSFFQEPADRYAVWSVNGRYVSALRLEAYQDGLLLSSLETAPGERRKGYAAELIKAVLSYLQAQGCTTVYSHVSKQNLPSVKIHLACGFEIHSDFASYLDGSVDSRAYTLRYKNF